MKLAFFPQLFGISLSLLSGLNVFAAATISCESFDVRLDAQGRVDLVERSGVPVPVVGTKGFFLTRDGRDESPLEIFSNGPRLRLRWAQGVEVDLKLSNRGTYLTVEVTKFSNLDRDAVFGFEWELGGGVTGGIQELDYMTERVRTSPGGGRVERGHLWETSPDNPLGGFALYVADSPDQADERLYEIWGRENLPHPAVEGDWTPETARAWVDRWLRELHAGNNTSVLAADAMNEAELYEMVEFAHTHGFRYLWMWCGNWRGQYWLKGARSTAP